MVIQVESLSSGYGDIQVLWDVSLSITSGEIVALVGGNGAGKTTSLNAISGLQVTFVKGKITVGGTEITQMAPHNRVSIGISHVPQGRQLFPFMTVQENLQLGAFTIKERSVRNQILEEVVELFPILKERYNQNAGSLSGGEQQMCAIARGLMSKPKFLLLDEPSLGLAPIMIDKVMEVIQTIAKKGVGILLVEQNVAKALNLAQKAYVIEHGKIVLKGPAADLLNDNALRKAYLGM